MIVQRPGGDLVIRGMITNAISRVLVAVSEGVESVTMEDVRMLKCNKIWKVFSCGCSKTQDEQMKNCTLYL